MKVGDVVEVIGYPFSRCSFRGVIERIDPGVTYPIVVRIVAKISEEAQAIDTLLPCKPSEVSSADI